VAPCHLIPAVAYYRMSLDRQEDSIERQRSQVVAYAAKHGFQIVREYIDEGIAGDVIFRRSEFQRMLRDAQTGAFTAILCDDKDRFGRFDSIDLGEIVAPLRRAGVWLETVAQGKRDWDSFAGRISDAVLQEAKSMELDAISHRVLSNQLLRAQKGQTTGGRATYGYRWEADLAAAGGKRLVPDGLKADVVRLIFRMYDEGHTLFAIATELHARGVPSPRGRGHWTRAVIQRVLTNRRYTGDWTWGVHPQGKRNCFGKNGLQPTVRGKKVPRRNDTDAWVIIPQAHEPLVDRAVFERVQARLRGNQVMTTPHADRGSYVLTRLLVCGHCGSFMRGYSAYGKRMYLCGGYLAYGKSYCNCNKVPEETFVRFLLKLLRERYLDPERLRELRAEMAALQASQRSTRNRGRLQARIDELAHDIDQGNERLLKLPPDRIDGVVAKLRQWEREREQLLGELRQAEQSSPVEDLEQQITAAQDMLWRLRDAITNKDRPLLREVFHQQIARIELRYSHKKHRTITRATLSEGMVYLRASQGPSLSSPSAGRSRSLRFRARPG
jgi:DNA invertase Pin-like site-specific DNA recombinase